MQDALSKDGTVSMCDTTVNSTVATCDIDTNTPARLKPNAPLSEQQFNPAENNTEVKDILSTIKRGEPEEVQNRCSM